MFQKPSPDIAINHNEKNRDDNVETVVGPSVHVEGDFNSEGNILVKGSVAGKVSTSKLLTVEPGAVVMADIKAANAIISGEIRGNAKIENELELTETGRIFGDIKCQVLVVHAGAGLMGKVTMPGFESSTTKKGASKGRGKAGKVEDDTEEEQ